MNDAKTHIEEAYRILTGEVFNGTSPDAMRPVDGICTLVWDLERIDAAIGERGKSVFASMAQTIQQAYIEICAARQAIQASHDEAAALAAHQCVFLDGSGLYGDEHGNQRCAKHEKLLKASAVLARKAIP